MPIKPVLKVWCLPVLPEEKLVILHKDLVAAAASVKQLGLNNNENDLIVLFPADMMRYGLGSEILIEYNDVVDHWRRDSLELARLAAKLGNVVKHIPNAFVQSEVVTGDRRYRHHWTSEQPGTREEVDRVCAAYEGKLPNLWKQARENCYCEMNAADHKGPCNYCNHAATYEHIAKEGRRILAITELAEFQAAADVYVANCTAA